MTADHVAGMAKAIDRAAHDNPYGNLAVARAAWGYALAALREPGEAMQEAATNRALGWLAIRDAVAVFARENGIDLPEPAAPPPEPLPASRTPDGFAL